MRKEIILTLIFVAFLIFFGNPFSLWMPETAVYMVIGGLFVLTAVYAGLVLREKPQDEREEKHRASAGRLGFISGIIILVIAIAFQSFNSHPDFWLIAALGVMIISKMFALLWKNHKE